MPYEGWKRGRKNNLNEHDWWRSACCMAPNALIQNQKRAQRKAPRYARRLGTTRIAKNNVNGTNTYPTRVGGKIADLQ